MAKVTGGLTAEDVQRLLAEVSYYKGAVDGDPGPQTMRAVGIIETNAGRSRADWPKAQRLVAAAQAVLDAQGFHPGPVDGMWGPNTAEAVIAWRSARAGTDASVPRPPLPGARTSEAQGMWPLQKDVAAFFGPSGGARCVAGICRLPFSFPLAWDLSSRLTQFRCHDLVAKPLTTIFAEAAKHYGESRFRDLRLDRFGGCYNYRPMRGGTATSMHAWGIAVDLDPERNQLRWGADRAAFARHDYEPFWRIVLSVGAVPAGYAWGKDWMHFQFARL